MENFSFNGMCLLELRVGFSWGRVSFLYFYSQVLMDVGQVIEGNFSSPFCFISKEYENVLCVKMAPVVPSLSPEATCKKSRS